MKSRGSGYGHSVCGTELTTVATTILAPKACSGREGTQHHQQCDSRAPDSLYTGVFSVYSLIESAKRAANPSCSKAARCCHPDRLTRYSDTNFVKVTQTDGLSALDVTVDDVGDPLTVEQLLLFGNIMNRSRPLAVLVGIQLFGERLC